MKHRNPDRIQFKSTDDLDGIRKVLETCEICHRQIRFFTPPTGWTCKPNHPFRAEFEKDGGWWVHAEGPLSYFRYCDPLFLGDRKATPASDSSPQADGFSIPEHGDVIAEALSVPVPFPDPHDVSPELKRLSEMYELTTLGTNGTWTPSLNQTANREFLIALYAAFPQLRDALIHLSQKNASLRKALSNLELSSV